MLESYLFIDKNFEKIEYGMVENKKLKFYSLKRDLDIEIGDIFRVRVKKKIPALNCYFVELNKDTEGFLDFKDVIGDIKLGDVIFVEVYKINLNGKAPNVSMNISISSNFSVISYKNTGISKSRKLIEFKFDFKLLESLDINYGVKLRTSCLGNDEEMIVKDIKENLKKFNDILDTKNNLPVPKLLYKKENYLADFLFKNSKQRCIVNDKEIYKNLKENKFIKNELIFDENYSLRYDENVGRYVEAFKNKEINVDNINIVIEKFEALTVIDVNSKKNTNSFSKSENAFNVNILALNEIIRQIIFRNISGIIIIDFINMNLRDRKKFEEKIENVNIFDDRKWSFHGFTKTGLYEITRQRQ